MMDREVYPSAPVVLVALEVRHPAAAPMNAAAVSRAKKVLSGVTPLAGEAQMTTVTITPGATNQHIIEVAPRFSSRDRTTAVTFRLGAVVVETTRYDHYERLREIAERAFEAREAAGSVDGIERVGLRYIDEIRVPGAEDLLSWSQWVDSALVGPAPLAAAHGLTTAQWQGVTVFEGTDRSALVLRYGPRDGYAVDPGGELRRPAPGPGPFFLLDIDSYWAPDDVPAFDLQALLERCDALHKPVRGLFESLITDKLREEVLRNVG